MPAINDPYNNRPYDGPSRTAPPRRSGSGGSGSASVRVRLGTLVHRGALTSALAHGTLESRSPELARRARQLTSEHGRRSVARAMRRAVAEAHRPPVARSRLGLVRRRAVLEAEPAIDSLIDRINSPVPIRAEGMAMTELILNNAERSPLYNFAEPGTLRRHVKLATAAMDHSAHSSRSHEFGLAA